MLSALLPRNRSSIRVDETSRVIVPGGRVDLINNRQPTPHAKQETEHILTRSIIFFTTSSRSENGGSSIL